MKRPLILYLLLVMAPAAVLAYLALEVADRDHEKGLRELNTRLEEEGQALVQRLQSAFDDGTGKARTVLQEAADRFTTGVESPFDAPVGFMRGGQWIGYSPFDHDDASVVAAVDKERHLFELSMQGGESYELGRGDPERAIDAYSFYLPQVNQPRWRDRLRFRIARAALAADRQTLAFTMLGEVFESDREAVTEEGLPVALLAAGLLAGHDKKNDMDFANRVRDSLRHWAPRLSTARLTQFMEGLTPDDEQLTLVIQERRMLEDAIASAPAMFSSSTAAFVDDALLVARELGTDSGTVVRAVTRVSLVLPDLSAGNFMVRLEQKQMTSDQAAAAGQRIILPVRSGDGGPEMARLVVEDLDHGSNVAALERRLLIARLFVGFLILVTLGGGGVLVVYLERERRLVKLRADLLANVSHELKTPVTSIRMFSEMLAEDPYNASRTRRFGQLLLSESLRLVRIIENVLVFSRLGRKEHKLELEPVDMHMLIDQVTTAFEPRAREEGVAFRLEGLPAEPPEGGLILKTNANAVDRIITNLLDNALKYRGSEAPEVVLRYEEHPGRVRLVVVDNGVGVPVRERERIFEEFYRVRYEDYGVQGSGLGLSIARRLARGLGGDLVLESHKGTGSIFTLELPAPERLLEEAAVEVDSAVTVEKSDDLTNDEGETKAPSEEAVQTELDPPMVIQMPVVDSQKDNGERDHEQPTSDTKSAHPGRRG